MSIDGIQVVLVSFYNSSIVKDANHTNIIIIPIMDDNPPIMDDQIYVPPFNNLFYIPIVFGVLGVAAMMFYKINSFLQIYRQNFDINKRVIPDETEEESKSISNLSVHPDQSIEEIENV